MEIGLLKTKYKEVVNCIKYLQRSDSDQLSLAFN